MNLFLYYITSEFLFWFLFVGLRLFAICYLVYRKHKGDDVKTYLYFTAICTPIISLVRHNIKQSFNFLGDCCLIIAFTIVNILSIITYIEWREQLCQKYYFERYFDRYLVLNEIPLVPYENVESITEKHYDIQDSCGFLVEKDLLFSYVYVYKKKGILYDKINLSEYKKNGELVQRTICDVSCLHFNPVKNSYFFDFHSQMQFNAKGIRCDDYPTTLSYPLYKNNKIVSWENMDFIELESDSCGNWVRGVFVKEDSRIPIILLKREYRYGEDLNTEYEVSEEYDIQGQTQPFEYFYQHMLNNEDDLKALYEEWKNGKYKTKVYKNGKYEESDIKADVDFIKELAKEANVSEEKTWLAWFASQYAQYNQYRLNHLNDWEEWHKLSYGKNYLSTYEHTEKFKDETEWADADIELMQTMQASINNFARTEKGEKIGLSTNKNSYGMISALADEETLDWTLSINSPFYIHK